MSDDYFVDGFHGGDIVYGNILLDMVSKGSSISEYIDDSALKI